MDYLQQWQSPSGRGVVEKAGFQGENNGLHRIIKKCITEYTPREGELGKLLGRLILAFRIVRVLFAFFLVYNVFKQHTKYIFDLNLYRKDSNNTVPSKQGDSLNEFGNCNCCERQQLSL